jgi:hypothetical protein
MVNHTLEAGTMTISLSPYGLHLYARDYLRQSGHCQPPKTGFSPVPYYLVCHSLELALKAYTLAKGVQSDGADQTYTMLQKLRRILSHNLEKALKRAKDAGITTLVPIDADDEAEVRKANAYYEETMFEYFFPYPACNGYQNLPDLQRLRQLTNRILDASEQLCLNPE